MGAQAYVALGSNLGDRDANLCAALDALRRHVGIRVVAASRFWETAPVGGPPDQGAYLNAAAQLDTDLSPRELLNALLTTERQLGRVRREKNGPRTIDLDLLLYGDVVVNEPDLIVPHPRLHERGFMLGPLAEIAPTVVHPVYGRTVVELLPQLGTQELRGKRAMVTGSSSGIGKAIALALAAKGADVLIHCRQSRDRAEQARAQARQHGVRSEVLTADLRDPAACTQLVEQAWARFGGLEIWINNAGADTLTGAEARMPFEAKLQELLAVDVTATMLLARAVGERMKPTGGVIVNMGWDQAETGMEGDSGQLFAAAKAAVMGFTKSLALSLAPHVRVNCLAPGWIRTAWGESASEDWQQRAIREAPLGRWGTPDDVAQVACWLVSPAAAFVTGQVIRINGGAVR